MCVGEKSTFVKIFFSDLCQWIFSGLISNSRQSFGGGELWSVGWWVYIREKSTRLCQDDLIFTCFAVISRA